MINANLDLNTQTEALLMNLEENIGVSKDQLISAVVNNTFNEEITEEMEDLALLSLANYMEENNPNAKTYTHEEVKVMLGF